MPQYSYTAKSLKGEIKSGTSEAKNEQEVATILRQQGYILISTDLESGKAIRAPLMARISSAIPFLNKVSLADKIMFARNLQIMIKTGISLSRAMEVLSNQTTNKKFRKILLEIKQDIIKGDNFSDILAKHPDVFSELFFNMVKVGEETGTLDRVLSDLVKQMEKEHQLKSRVQGAMVYPSVILVAMVLIGILMLILVVPKLADTFDDLGIELPMTTKAVIATGVFLSNFWYLFPIIIIVMIILARMVVKTKKGKLVFDNLLLKIPVVSPVLKKTYSAYTVRVLSCLFESSVPIVKSLNLVAGSLGNIYYKNAMLDAAEQVKKGAKLGEVLKKYEDIYPVLVIQMVEVGEETGETSKILDKLADFYEEEVGNATKNLSTVIEPVLMLLVGAVIGFFAVSMIQPMYSMTGSL